jgi:hypothetical protein
LRLQLSAVPAGTVVRHCGVDGQMVCTPIIMPRSSWPRKWQWTTYSPVKSRNRLRVVIEPHGESIANRNSIRYFRRPDGFDRSHGDSGRTALV